MGIWPALCSCIWACQWVTLCPCPSVGTNMGREGSDAVASSKTGTCGRFWCGPEVTLSSLSTTTWASSQDLPYLEAQLALNSLADPGLLTLALVPVSRS